MRKTNSSALSSVKIPQAKGIHVQDPQTPDAIGAFKSGNKGYLSRNKYSLFRTNKQNQKSMKGNLYKQAKLRL